MNILSNAVKFSPQQATISVVLQHKLTPRLESDNIEMVEIRIADQGAGIPGFAAQKIFDKFFSLQRPDSGEKSTGLGLNFVKEVATLHGGDIVLENREPKGVRANLTLPIL